MEKNPIMPINYQASFYPAQAVALAGYHYRPYGRFCALPSRHALGRTALVSYRVTGHWSRPARLLVADVCGTAGRVDLPEGAFRAIYGREGVRRGLMPIRIISIGGRVWHRKKARR